MQIDSTLNKLTEVLYLLVPVSSLWYLRLRKYNWTWCSYASILMTQRITLTSR